jgi:hypothetical protein
MTHSTSFRGGLRALFAATCLILTTAAFAQVTVEEKVAYLGSPNNIRLSNGKVELILTTDYGPRIMRYAFVGSGDAGNIFGTVPGVTSKTELGEWYIRGGHRLWHAPEGMPRTYEPDNDPIKVEREGNTIKLIQPMEKTTRISKEMHITLDPQTPHVRIVHKLTNNAFFTVPMACWALSVMNTSGLGIFPQEPYKPHPESLLPVRPMVLWSYTDMKDPRWTWGKSFITLRQDPSMKEPQKIGMLNRQGWAAYHRNGALFLKRFPFQADKTYPDYNSNLETFTNDAILEIETLGPLEQVAPGMSITHTEDWYLYKVADLGNGEAGIAAALQPILSVTAPSK